jgi:hypothetical protein
MRGAILHKLGLDLVTSRVMRRHYGITKSRSFRYGDPTYMKYTALDGEIMCGGVMDWYVQKVRPPDGLNSNVQHQQVSHRQKIEKEFCTDFTEYKYKYYSALHFTLNLYASDEHISPTYIGSSCAFPIAPC